MHSDTETFTNVEMDIRSIHHHPEFHAGLSRSCHHHHQVTVHFSGNLYNDIALVKLAGSVDLASNPHISPVCLPDGFQVISSRRPSQIIFLQSNISGLYKPQVLGQRMGKGPIWTGRILPECSQGMTLSQLNNFLLYSPYIISSGS